MARAECADDDGVGADFRGFFADRFFAFAARLEIGDDFVGAVRHGAEDGDLGGFLGRKLLAGVVAVGDIRGAGAEQKRGSGCEEERNAGDHKEEWVLLGFAGLVVEDCSDISRRVKGGIQVEEKWNAALCMAGNFANGLSQELQHPGGIFGLWPRKDRPMADLGLWISAADGDIGVPEWRIGALRQKIGDWRWKIGGKAESGKRKAEGRMVRLRRGSRRRRSTALRGFFDCGEALRAEGCWRPAMRGGRRGVSGIETWRVGNSWIL
jgi:hypothetical protein